MSARLIGVPFRAHFVRRDVPPLQTFALKLRFPVPR